MPRQLEPEFPNEVVEKRLQILGKCLAEWTGDPIVLLDISTWVSLVQNTLQKTGELVKYRTHARQYRIIQSVYNLFVNKQGQDIALKQFTRNKIPSKQIEDFVKARSKIETSDRLVSPEYNEDVSSDSTELAPTDFSEYNDVSPYWTQTKLAPTVFSEYNEVVTPNSTQLAPTDFSENNEDVSPKWTDLVKPASAIRLTNKMLNVLSTVVRNFNGKEDNKIVVQKFTLSVTIRELMQFDCMNWLEDRNIDFYLEMIRERNNKSGSGLARIYIFHSFVFKMLVDSGFESVMECTGNDNIFEDYEMIFFPVHSRDHWRLIVADLTHRTLTSYDSLSISNRTNMEYIWQYLRWECGEKMRNGGYLLDWSIQKVLPHELPQQRNYHDCGIFLLQYADYLARRIPLPFDFTQAHIPYFRQRMAYETVIGELLN